MPLLTVLLSLTALLRPVRAHNGAVAIAVPVEGIVVDGDLSDWPEGCCTDSIAVFLFHLTSGLTTYVV